jgi:hypothetical protein
VTLLRSLRPGPAFVAAGLVLAGCQERLTAPGECPTFCPGQFGVRDTILAPLADQDTGYIGFILAGEGTSLLVSDRLPAGEDRTVIRFTPRPDSVRVDSVRVWNRIDSVAFEVSVLARDTLVHNPVLYLFRLPAQVDSTTTFAQVEAQFSPGTIIDSFVVADSPATPRLRALLTDSAAIARVAIPDADSSVLAIGLKLTGASPNGFRVGSAGSGTNAPRFITYVTVQTPDSMIADSVSVAPEFNTFVAQSPTAVDSSLLNVGGAPSARSLIRFPWSGILKDSATILRATLELVPTAPIIGLAGDSTFLDIHPILKDFGAKSPLSVSLATQLLTLGSSDTVSVEVVDQVRLWQTANGALPPALMLSMFPEAGSFTHAAFGSTRTPGFAPVLRVSYSLRYPFGNP